MCGSTGSSIIIDVDYNFNDNNRLGSGHQLIRIKIKPKPYIFTTNRVENCCATVFAAFGRGSKIIDWKNVESKRMDGG